MTPLSNLLMQTFDTDEAKKRRIWNKAKPAYGHHPDWVRLDDHNRLIHYNEYGNRKSTYGWEYDHYPLPMSLGGGDDETNLRPLHWHSNATHGGLLSALFT